MAKRILLTGGAGFIGRELIRSLILRDGQGNELPVGNVIDVLDTDEAVMTNLSYMGRFRKFIRRVEDIKTEYDVIIHAGAISDSRCSDKFALVETNYALTMRLAEIQQSISGCQLLYFSSASVYGDGVCDELSYKFQPQTSYAYSKVLSEYALKGVSGVCIVRPFNVYGKGEFSKAEHTRSFIYRVAYAAAGLDVVKKIDVHSLQAIRDFISVEDVGKSVAALVNPLDNQNFFIGKAYNLGTGNPLSIEEVVKTAAKEVNSQQFMNLIKNPYKDGEYQSVSKALFDPTLPRPYDQATFSEPKKDIKSLVQYLRKGIKKDE